MADHGSQRIDAAPRPAAALAPAWPCPTAPRPATPGPPPLACPKAGEAMMPATIIRGTQRKNLFMLPPSRRSESDSPVELQLAWQVRRRRELAEVRRIDVRSGSRKVNRI